MIFAKVILLVVVAGLGSAMPQEPLTEAPVEPTEAPVDPSEAPPQPSEAPVDPVDPRCPVNCEYRSVDCECSDYFQCKNGVYERYSCPDGLHFNQASLQCDVKEQAGCNLDPETCCKCEYRGVDACGPNYIFQDHNRNVTYEGARHCIQDPRSCENGLVWNDNANGADKDGACDLRKNVAACS